MSTPLLELNHVSKSFAGAPVLQDVNLRIAEGDFVAIVGFSGAGKSTLIHLISGLLTPDTGTVRLAGQPVTGPGRDRGVVFQNYSLLPWLTVFENIALAVDQAFPDWDVTRRREHVERHIALVNLTPARNKLPRELSGGMRQRVSVARALAMDPKILLLDEPLGALDALTRAVLQDEIARIWEQDRKTVVLITNDVDEGVLLADRIIPLTPGPGATLGPEVPVPLARPRNRKAMQHDENYKVIRREVLGFLIGCRQKQNAAVTRKLRLPDVLPEDLTIPPRWFAPKPRPKRRNEMKEETVEVAA